MTNDLDHDDLEKVSDLLIRARAAIMESGWQAPTLGILDWYAPGSPVRVSSPRPALEPLAEEYATIKPLIAALVGADAADKVPFHFRTFAHDETSNWELGDTPLAGVPVFGLYLIREGDPTGYGKFLENVFCYSDSDAAPRNQYGQGPMEAYLDGKGSDLPSNNGGLDGWEGALCTRGDACVTLDANPALSQRVTFGADLCELDLSKLDAGELTPRRVRDELLDRLADDAAESAFEWFSGNAMHPKVLLAA